MEQTLSVAHRLFADRGYAELTMDELAAAVGVTKPLLYHYFGNKERLYIACMERVGDGLLGMIAAAVGESRDPAEALRAGLHAFFDFLDSDRAAWSVLFDETSAHVGAVAQRVSEYRARIADLVAGSLLARLQPERRAAARTEVEAVSIALLGAAEALARWWLTAGRALAAPEVADLLIATVEPGLRMRASGKRAPALCGEGGRSAEPRAGDEVTWQRPRRQTAAK